MTALTIDTGIAALSVTGLTIKAVTAIPESVLARDCPLFMANPDNWLGETATTDVFENSQAVAVQTRYTLNYLFLYASAGSGRGLKDHFSGFATTYAALRQKLIKMDLPLISITNVTASNFGMITDATTKSSFYGALVTVTAREIS